MRFLRSFFRTIEHRLLSEILLAEALDNIVTTHRNGVITQMSRVGAHIGYITGLIETLRHHHGLLYPEAKSSACSLLEG